MLWQRAESDAKTRGRLSDSSAIAIHSSPSFTVGFLGRRFVRSSQLDRLFTSRCTGAFRQEGSEAKESPLDDMLAKMILERLNIGFATAISPQSSLSKRQTGMFPFY